MKKYMIFGILLLLGVLIMGCTKPTGNIVSDIQSSVDLKETTLQIEGMTCKSCALGVEFELKQVNGVEDARVNYKTGKAIVNYDSNLVDALTIAKASTAYPAKVIG